MDNMDNYMYHPESERRQRMTAKKEKANNKYINKRTGNGHGRLGKVARGLSSSKTAWSETRQYESIRKDSLRNMKMSKMVLENKMVLQNKNKKVLQNKNKKVLQNKKVKRI
jgi:hypothetical protein